MSSIANWLFFFDHNELNTCFAANEIISHRSVDGQIFCTQWYCLMGWIYVCLINFPAEDKAEIMKSWCNKEMLNTFYALNSKYHTGWFFYCIISYALYNNHFVTILISLIFFLKVSDLSDPFLIWQFQVNLRHEQKERHVFLLLKISFNWYKFHLNVLNCVHIWFDQQWPVAGWVTSRWPLA